MTEWTRRRADTSMERTIVTGMITSNRVLRNLALTYKPRYFTVPFAQVVAKWCLAYLEKYGEAPQRHIQDLYEAYRRSGSLDPDVSQLIGQFLTSISEEYEREGLNEEYLLDQAQEFFVVRSLTLLKEDLEERLEQGNILAARESVASFISPEKVITLGCEPLRDMEAVRDAFTIDDDLFTLPGDLGKLLGPMVREDVWGLVGAYKAGKSWACTYIQDQALYNRLNVARFSFEMNRRKESRRFLQSICSMPINPPKDGKIWIPVWDCKFNQDGSCYRPDRTCGVALYKGEEPRPSFGHESPGYKPCASCRGQKGWQMETWAEEWKCDVLTWRNAWRKAESISQQLRGARFKFQYWPMYSAGIPEVKAALHIWEHMEGFIPDVIVIDSPDLMKKPGQTDRHSIVDNRRYSVALAQQYHSLLIMPFQAGSKDAIERKTKKRSDIGESVAILGDVDGMISLDQTDSEREAMRARIGVSVQRDNKSVLANQVTVLQCIELGQAVIDSAFVRNND